MINFPLNGSSYLSLNQLLFLSLIFQGYITLWYITLCFLYAKMKFTSSSEILPVEHALDSLIFEVLNPESRRMGGNSHNYNLSWTHLQNNYECIPPELVIEHTRVSPADLRWMRTLWVSKLYYSIPIIAFVCTQMYYGLSGLLGVVIKTEKFKRFPHCIKCQIDQITLAWCNL